jgi:hypothetical protein
MQGFSLHPSFYGLLVLQIWRPPILSIVMNVNCSRGGKNFLCKFCHFNTLFGAHQVEDVILVIFKLSKFIVFFFRLFQFLELLKYLLIYLWHNTDPLSTKTFEMFTFTIIYYC